jgi:hypothetical protein
MMYRYRGGPGDGADHALFAFFAALVACLLLLAIATPSRAEELYWWLRVENGLNGEPFVTESRHDTEARCRLEADLINDTYDGAVTATCYSEPVDESTSEPDDEGF